MNDGTDGFRLIYMPDRKFKFRPAAADMSLPYGTERFRLTKNNFRV